jgi:hypothetical protein
MLQIALNIKRKELRNKVPAYFFKLLYRNLDIFEYVNFKFTVLVRSTVSFIITPPIYSVYVVPHFMYVYTVYSVYSEHTHYSISHYLLSSILDYWLRNSQLRIAKCEYKVRPL